MSTSQQTPNVSLPKGWKKQVRSAVLHVLSLAQYAAAYTRSWAADSTNARVRLKAELDRANEELLLLREEIRIKNARLARIDPHRRPHYPPIERMAILQLKAARGWSLEQTARVFHITAATGVSWIKRVDEQGADASVQLREPVNRLPDFVRYAVQQLKIFRPSLGKKKIAETLARSGLHLGTTTVGRILKEKPAPSPELVEGTDSADRVVTSKYPNYLGNVDLTVVPTGAGFWCSWLPFTLPQRWPFCWWLAVAVDHYSRRLTGFAIFSEAPNSIQVRSFLGRTIRVAGQPPKHLISDQGGQFWCDGFQTWCRHRNIKPRFGAVGKHGSIAVVERFILTLKQLLRQLPRIPLRRESFRHELVAIIQWYNKDRAHTTLGGQTPNEVYAGRFPAHRQPRIEPRPRWPRGSPCAKPWALVAGKPGPRFQTAVTFYTKRRHLPIVTLKRAA